MLRSFPIVVATLLVVPATAQITTRVVVQEELLVDADGIRRTVPVGTDVSAGVTLGVSTQSCHNYPGYANLTVGVTGSEVRWDSDAASGCAQGGRVRGAVLIRYTSPTPVLATVQASAPRGSNRGTEVDIGNDGSVEVFGATLRFGDFERVVLVDAQGVDVLLRGSITTPALHAGGASARTTVRLVTSGAHVTGEGSPCGPTLRADYEDSILFIDTRTHRLALSVTGSIRTSSAFFVFGITQRNLRIPPTGCPLRTDMLIAVPVVVDANGRVDVSLDIPATLTLGDLRTQYLVANAAQDWFTSEAIRFRLP